MLRTVRTLLQWRGSPVGWLLATVGTGALTALLAATRNLHDLPLEMLLFLGLTVGCALLGGFGPALASALLGSLALNWFFTPPTHTFTIDDPQNVVAVVVFVIVALGVGSAVHLSDRRAAAARAAQREAQALAASAENLLGEVDPMPALLQHTVEVFAMAGAGLVRRGSSRDPWQVLAATSGFDPTLVDQSAVRAPVAGGSVLVLQGHVVTAADRRVVSAFAAHAAALLRRQELAAQAGSAAELARGNRSRTALLAAVSHDLRTPLAGIKAAVSTLREPGLSIPPADEADLLETIEESTDRLTALVTNLLDASRLQSDSVRTHLTDVSVADVVDAALAGSTQDGEVRLELASDLPAVTTDPGLLERVLANLVENARRYAVGRGPVQVQAAHLPGRVQIRVVDRGPGVPDAQKEAIFAPFQRVGDAPVGDGVGLGLAVSRGLVDTIGGTLTAEDTPGGGLTMVLDLPLSPVPDGAPAPHTEPEGAVR